GPPRDGTRGMPRLRRPAGGPRRGDGGGPPAGGGRGGPRAAPPGAAPPARTGPCARHPTRPSRAPRPPRRPPQLTETPRPPPPALAAAGMILDLTHLADQSWHEALDLFTGHVMASHSNCRALVPGERQSDDGALRRVIERGGVIGAALDAWMLYPGWQKGETANTVVGLDAVADQIDHVCQLAGNARHAAIGSDLAGGYGWEPSPPALSSLTGLPRV